MAGRIFSGIQPSGKLHLGNYLGAVKIWSQLQSQHQALFCIVDLHAMTINPDAATLKRNVTDLLAGLLACGLDPAQATIFVQSANRDHCELHWYLSCVARMGWLTRMTQFKDKAGQDKERAPVGLYVYPILMAADILLYDTTLVPVGEDQVQHLELARMIAKRFNNAFQPVFTIPETLTFAHAGRIMSLKDGQRKMSKSEPGQAGCILIDDSDDQLASKIRRAKTDPLPLPEDMAGLDGRPEAHNLIGIYAGLTGTEPAEALRRFAGAQFSGLKAELTAVLIDKWGQIRQRYHEFRDQPDLLASVLERGAETARGLSRDMIAKVRLCFGSS